MRFMAWAKTREKMLAPLLLGVAAVLWVVAVLWKLLAEGVPLWSPQALQVVYTFGLGGKAARPPQETLLELAALLGKGGAALAALYAYLRVLDVGLDRVMVRLAYRDHVVIVGLGEKARRLALSLRTDGRRVVVLERDPLHPLAPEVRAQGVAVLHRDGRSPEALAEAALRRAAALVCLADDDAVNLQVAREARALPGPRTRALRCVVHVGDRGLRQIASEATQYRHQDPRFDGRVLDLADAAARHLLAAYPPDALAPLHRPGAPRLHLLVAGADDLARALVVNLALQAHYAAPNQPVVTLLDPLAPQALARLQAEYPALGALLEVRAVPASPLHLAPAQLEAALGPGLPTPVLACVTVPSEAEGLAIGLHLARLWGLGTPGSGVRPRVVVGVPPQSRVMAAVGVDPAGEPLGFACFDRYSACTAEAVLGEGLDARARARHQAYLDQLVAAGRPLRQRPTQCPWDELDERVKASNRRQVVHEAVQWRALDARGDDPAVLECLAEAEHRRWVADRLLSGWSHGPVRDDTRLVHPDLVPYAELDEATREFDRSVVRDLARRWREARATSSAVPA